jgi:iron-sulfur cluster repair protein YtfE (RIC family)
LSETLMMIMQQHNMKEEQMLYPMMDQTLGQAGAEIAEQIRQLREV